MRPSFAILIAAAACVAPLATHAQFKAYGYATPSYIEFSNPRYEVAGTETNAVVTVVRHGEFRVSAKVEYATKDGTAEGAVNFHPCGGTLTFNPGESFKNISIPIIRDEPLPTASFQVELTPVSSDTIVITPTAEVAIQAPAPALSITANAQAITIQWPNLGQFFNLEALVNDAWTQVANPASLSDGEWTVQISPSVEAPLALFRLKQAE